MNRIQLIKNVSHRGYPDTVIPSYGAGKNYGEEKTYLEMLGLVELKKTKDKKRTKTTPSVEYDKILVEIAV